MHGQNHIKFQKNRQISSALLRFLNLFFLKMCLKDI